MQTKLNPEDAPQVVGPEGDASATIDLPSQQEGGNEYVPQDPATQVPQEKEEDWEQKYKVLQGKYNAEVPRLNKELKRLRREKEQLAKRVEMLELILSQKQNEPPASTPQPQQEETDPEVEKLKQEFPELYSALQKLLTKKLSTVDSKLSEVKSNLTQQTFFAQLSALVPDWQQLNTDPDFLDWLQETEPSTGLTRHQIMLAAFEKGDAAAVARFFNTYKAQLAQAQTQKEQTPPPAAKTASPPSRQASGVTRSPSKKIWKESEIRNFYKRAAVGSIPPDEVKRIEAEISKAALENRILYGK